MHVFTKISTFINIDLYRYIDTPNVKSMTAQAPNFEEVDGAYWFRVVCASVRPCIRSSRTMHTRILKFHLWIADTRFLSCPSYLPFWSYALLKKSEWNLMHAISYEPCMLGFWNFIYMIHTYMDSSWKNSWPVFFFLFELSLFLEIFPFEKIRIKSYQQDISKRIWAMGLKLG